MVLKCHKINAIYLAGSSTFPRDLKIQKYPHMNIELKAIEPKEHSGIRAATVMLHITNINSTN
jgi:hypothetical protein